MYQNEPQNPQDTCDILGDALDLFLAEIGEISNSIRKINEETMLCESLKIAE